MYYNRFLNVVRYNLIINRAHYMKMALALFLVMALPLLLLIMKSVWLLSFTQAFTPDLDEIIPGSTLTGWMSGCFIVAMPVICGYTFHNLLTRQSRIRELTLPASNGEKFLFHALITVGGAVVTYWVSYVIIDLLQYLYVGLVYDFSRAQWFPLHDSGESNFWLLLNGYLGVMAFYSTFVLGNALKYRHNVLWTILFHWALGFLSMLGLGLLIPLLLDVDPSWIINIKPEQVELATKIGLALLFSLVIAFCWWMSYRLYCRAQITTSRNK